MHTITISQICAVVILLLILIAPASTINSIYKMANAQKPATFPPPMMYQLKDIPSYAIVIPFTSTGESYFEPAEVNVPLGMTVIWFNNDHAYHTVTTVSNGSNLSPEKLNSGFIPMNGGSYIHTFNKVGKYNYYDQQHPSTRGIITVTGGMEKGKNLNMLIGGKIPFNPYELSHVLLRFVPTTISIPPDSALTYNVTISKSNGTSIFGHNYIDSDGILDLELVPMQSNATKITSHDFTTWGPDFNSQESFRTTGTYHIKGPILIQDSPYRIKVDIVSKDNKILSPPIGDLFLIPSQIKNNNSK